MNFRLPRTIGFTQYQTVACPTFDVGRLCSKFRFYVTANMNYRNANRASNYSEISSERLLLKLHYFHEQNSMRILISFITWLKNFFFFFYYTFVNFIIAMIHFYMAEISALNLCT